jgi:hypothetical protein
LVRSPPFSAVSIIIFQNESNLLEIKHSLPSVSSILYMLFPFFPSPATGGVAGKEN